MAVNRYSGINWRQGVRGPEYIPMPFNEIAAVGAAKQKQHDQVEEDIYNTQKMLNINSDPANRTYRDSKVKYYNDKIASVADELHKTGEVAQIPGKIRNIAREYANDPEVKILNSNAVNYDLSQKDKSGLTKEGKFDSIKGGYDPYSEYATGYNPHEQGLKAFDYAGTKPVQDYSIPATKLMSDVAKQGGKDGSYGFDESGNIIGHKSGWEQVARKDISRVAAANLPVFIQTPEANYFKDRFYSLHPNASTQEVKQAAFDYLKGIGEKQIFRKSDNESDFKYAPSDIRQQESANQTTSTQTEGLNQLDKHNPLVDNMEFDKNGNLKSNNTKAQGVALSGHESPGQIGLSDSGQAKAATNKTSEGKAYISTLKQQYGLTGTDEEVVSAYKKANKTISNETMPVEEISNMSAKGLGEKLSRDNIGRTMFLTDSKGQTTDGTRQTVLDQLGISEVDFDKALKSGIVGYSQDAQLPGAYVAEVPDKDGVKRRITIEPDQQLKQIFSMSHGINEIRKSFNPGKVTVGQDDKGNTAEIIITPKISKDGTPSWNYIEKWTDSTGNTIKEVPTDLEKIKKVERDHLKKSNYLGSQVQQTKDDAKEME
jgi:hypothetical protein